MITLHINKLKTRVQRKFESLLRESQIEDLDVFSANADFTLPLPLQKLAMALN